MEIKKVFILLVLSFFFLNETYAKDESCTKSINKLSVPSMVIDSLFLKKASGLILPFPKDVCLKKGQDLSVVDEFSKKAAIIRIVKTWKGTYNDSKVSLMPADSLPKLYLKQASNLKLASHSLLDYLTQLIFDERFSQSTTKVLGFAIVKYKINPSYKLPYNYYSHITHYPYAKAINYQQLMNLYSKKNHFIINIQDKKKMNFVSHLPATKIFYKPKANYQRRPLPLSVASHQFGELNAKLPVMSKKQPKFVVVNFKASTNVGYNVINELLFQGAKEVYWLNDFYSFWFKKHTQRKIPNNFKISVQNLIRKIKTKSVTLVDLRSKEEHLLSSIANSVSIPIQSYRKDEYIKKMANLNPKLRLLSMKEIRKSKKSVFYYMDYKALPKNKPVVFFRNNTDSSANIHLLLRGKRFFERIKWWDNKVYILDGGLADFYSATKWQHPDLAPKYLSSKL